jgi:hypothetical protein
MSSDAIRPKQSRDFDPVSFTVVPPRRFDDLRVGEVPLVCGVERVSPPLNHQQLDKLFGASDARPVAAMEALAGSVILRSE